MVAIRLAFLLLMAMLFAGCTQAGCEGSCVGEPMECEHGMEWECHGGHCSYECAPAPQHSLGGPEGLEVRLVNFSSDKSECGSNELVSFFVAVESSADARANLTVMGIKPRNSFYINKRVEVELSQGMNELTVNATTPACTSGCGGVHPGDYEITAEVLVNGAALDKMNVILKLHS